MNNTGRLFQLVLVLLVVGMALLALISSNATTFADDTAQPPPVYPTKIPPPPGVDPPKTKSVGVIYTSGGSTLGSFQVYTFARNPYKSGSSVVGQSWQWTEYLGTPWYVQEMETWTYLWWWNSNEQRWIFKSSACSRSTNTWRCEADA